MSGLVTRTFEINDLRPEELAALFAGMTAEKQAEFFEAVWDIARGWPGAGWCQQSCEIAFFLKPDGRRTISTLAEHVDASVQL